MPPTPTSRTRLCSGIIDDDGDLVLTDPEPFLYRELPDNITHPVVQADTWQSIAYRYYGDALLYWVVVDFQPAGPVYDVTVALVPGERVVVPSLRTVQEDILSESRRQEFQA